MTQRITSAVLDQKVANVNRLLGEPFFQVQLYRAYGATAVERVIPGSTGTENLSGFGTAREAAKFLDGMRAALLLTGVTR